MSRRRHPPENFVAYFLTLTVARLYSIERYDGRRMMNRKGFWSERSLQNPGTVTAFAWRDWRKSLKIQGSARIRLSLTTFEHYRTRIHSAPLTKLYGFVILKAIMWRVTAVVTTYYVTPCSPLEANRRFGGACSRRYVPEDNNHHNHRCEILKSCIIKLH
jgi:hypothetical protein